MTEKNTNFNNIKTLTFLALLMALQICLEFFYIQVSDNLRIYFTFIIVMSIASIFPLKLVLIYAVIEDLIAFFIYPTGPFFVGYTITAFLSMLIYSLVLYKKVDVKRVIIAKTSVNLICNVLINSIWSAMLFSKGYIYYATSSLIKNISLLPFEIIIFIIFYKMVSPLFVKQGLIRSE